MNIEDVQDKNLSEIWGDLQELKHENPELYQKVIDKGVDVFRQLGEGNVDKVERELQRKEGAEALKAIQETFDEVRMEEKTKNEFLEVMGQVGLKVGEVALKLVL